MGDELKDAQVLIAGDVWPAVVGQPSLAQRLGLAVRPQLFIWTLDAAVAADTPRTNYTRFKFDASSLDELRLGEQNLAVTASNHITDFGDAGVRATCEALSSAGFLQVGAGVNEGHAARPAIVDLAAGRVAVLAFAEIEPRVDGIAATTHTAGIRPLQPNASLDAIREARRTCDWVWVVLHWGLEFVRYPDPQQRVLASAMLESGASLVVASHVHVPLGFEQQTHGSVYYGLGNFLYGPYYEDRGFRYHWIPAARQGVVLTGRCRDGLWHWEHHDIRHCRRGLPRLARHGNCPDYAHLLPADLSQYARVYPRLRRRERAIFVAQRIGCMSWQERAYRLRQLLRKSTS